MNELKSAASGGAIEGIPVSDVRSLRLPKDVTQWRVLHVQAWVAITMELPLYMDNFQQGSINGLVLLHHVTEDVLVNILGIADDLHLKKIMGGQRLLTHSRTYLITHSLAYLLTFSLTGLLTHLLTHSLTGLLTHSLTHSNPLTHSLTLS
jgi:hypothetical protein